MQERPQPTRPARVSWAWVWGVAEARWAVIATVLFAAGGLAQLVDAPVVLWWGLYLGCYLAGGWEPASAGLRALRQRTLDVDLLMIVAALAAAAIGQVFDGALLIVIFATSGALEAVATRRTADSVRALLDLAPERAVRIGPHGREDVVETAELVVDDIVLVRPGERIGADGEVLDGVSEVDQAAITGEPLPVLKQPGDEVFAGTVNGTGALRVRVGRPAADSVVARIVAMVERASATKARTQLFIERVEQRYSAAMVVATLALVAIPLALGAAFEPTLLRAMTFMIVASPCAVVLATMPPLLSAIANAGRHRVLIKSAVVMEKFGQATLVAFDKTGTLTEGAPRVAELAVVPAAAIHADEALTLAAATERSSEHPIARAVVALARERNLDLPAANGFTSAPGQGVSATVAGRCVRVGSPGLLIACGDEPDEGTIQARGLVRRFETGGRTAVVVLIDDVPVAVLAIADRLRPGARETVTALTALTGHSPILLTGDNQRAAEALASEVGITDVRACLLPAGKVDAVRALQADGHRVLLVGDGVNDAPAMATAHLGVAMGRQGSDLALETADAVIVRDELDTLPSMIGLSRRAHRVVRANLFIAAAVIVLLVGWDLVGTLPLPLGVAGHEGSTVIVGLNGMRLLHSRVWRRVQGGRSQRQRP
ncbi:heavy metal translocating P-type ATPase [Pseudonocardia alaniniphila]|uniref:Heavy metal translocating P-type ATPase n=1 Tax=Pseudonocardia alaniniphila TaxID=75291 RepID=A0ABS9TEE2_9PSEU|nr:heavy metal translocating P-type ATPase [Pseudonocardia alaniniphila]MCH6166910.1 heavy metal translocating P-type ATPase [Pseudonocardia alaniniphila]